MKPRSNTATADGGETRDPADADLDRDGADGAGPTEREPTAGKRADGAAKRDPASEEAPDPFDRGGAVAAIIDELGDLEGEDEPGEKAPDGDKADDQDGEADGDDADDAKGEQDDADDADGKEGAEADDAGEADQTEGDEAKDDDADDEDKAKGEDDAADDAAESETDPDIPSKAELAKAPKVWRKRTERLIKRLRDAEVHAKVSRSLADFAEKSNMPAPVVRDWLEQGAKVINAPTPLDGARILTDEVYAVYEDADPGAASDGDKAATLRRLADELDPDGATPAAMPELPKELKDLVEAGVMTEKAARAAQAADTVKDPKAKGKPDADTKRKEREAAVRLEAQRRVQYQRRVADGQNAMKAEARRVAKAHPALWKRLKAHVLKELGTTWKGAQPEQWGVIFKKEAAAYVAINGRTAQKKAPPTGLRPTAGARSSAKKGDDLDAILSED